MQASTYLSNAHMCVGNNTRYDIMFETTTSTQICISATVQICVARNDNEGDRNVDVIITLYITYCR
jgi:hypothetical protein